MDFKKLNDTQSNHIIQPISSVAGAPPASAEASRYAKKENMKATNRNLNLAAYIVLFGFSLVFGFLSKPTEMGLTIIAGSLGLAFLN